MHARQTVREAIATLLAATPSNWGMVLQTRLVTPRQVWPFLMVYVTEEAVDSLLIHPASIYDRTAQVNVVGMLKMPGMGNGSGDSETVEDRMDAMAAEIETKLTTATLTAAQPKVKTIALQTSGMEIVVNDEDGTVSHAVLTQVWQVSYVTAEGSPETLA